MEKTALFTNDAVVLGILFLILAFVFQTSASARPFWQKFYTYVPSVLLCYFLPGVLNSLNVISGEESQLYFVSSRYLLPASLILFTLGIGPTGHCPTGAQGGDYVFCWHRRDYSGRTASHSDRFGGLTRYRRGHRPGRRVAGHDHTIAGQLDRGWGQPNGYGRRCFEVGDTIFPAVLAVDIIVANVWLGVLLYGSGRADKIDRFFRADSSAITEVRRRMEAYAADTAKIPTTADLILILAIAFGLTGFSHYGSNQIAPFLAENYPILEQFSLTSGFFWIVVIATAGGLVLSFTRLRELEGAGASKLATVFLYVLIASIGMEMDITAVVKQPRTVLP